MAKNWNIIQPSSHTGGGLLIGAAMKIVDEDGATMWRI